MGKNLKTKESKEDEIFSFLALTIGQNGEERFKVIPYLTWYAGSYLQEKNIESLEELLQYGEKLISK